MTVLTTESITLNLIEEVSEGVLRPGEDLADPEDLAEAFGCTVEEAEAALGYMAEMFYAERTARGYRVPFEPGLDPDCLPVRRRSRRSSRYAA